MHPLLQQLQGGDLSAFSGARLRLSLPFKQEMLNEALSQARAGRDGALKEIQLEVREQNHVHVRLAVQILGLSKSLSFDLAVERDLGFPGAPRLRLSLPAAHPFLGKVLEILTASFGLLPGGVAIAGSAIEVDLSQAVRGPDASPEEAARAQALLALVKWGEIETRAGVLVLNLGLEVD